MRTVQLSRHSIAFPSPEGALREPNGLLALGGDLSPARLLMAYQRGIFPWFSRGDPILWWSPDPRAVLWPESLHISRSMKRFHKRSPYRVTMNYAFGQVIEGCASDREEGTGSRVAWSKPTIAFTNSAMPTPLKSGVKMSLSAVCTAWPVERYFVASPCSAGWKMRLKRRFWYSVRNLSVMAVSLSTARSLTITQHRLVPAKFPAGITLIISIKCASDDCRIISGYHDACFHHKNECFRHISPQSVIIAVAELVTLITPLPIRNFSRQVTPIVYLTAPLYVALLVRLSRVFSE